MIHPFLFASSFFSVTINLRRPDHAEPRHSSSTRRMAALSNGSQTRATWATRCRSRSSRAARGCRVCYVGFMRNGACALAALPLMLACSEDSSDVTPPQFVDGGAHVTSDLPAMPAVTWNSALAVKTTASFQESVVPAIALTISNVVIPNDVCGVAPLLEGSAFTNLFALEIKFAADPAKDDPIAGTFGNDAASASFTLSDATCASPIGTKNAANVLVNVHFADGVLTGTADLTFPDGHFAVSFTAPLCSTRAAIIGSCTTLPRCADVGGTPLPCTSWP